MEMLSSSRAERLTIVRQKFGSATQLARHLQCAVTSVTRTLNGEMTSEAMQTRIARACGKRRAAMFGPIVAASDRKAA